jgi:hypothetical protein
LNGLGTHSKLELLAQNENYAQYKLIFEIVEHITIQDIWHVQVNLEQNVATTFSWTLFEKLRQAQWLIAPPFTIFCKLKNISITNKK